MSFTGTPAGRTLTETSGLPSNETSSPLTPGARADRRTPSRRRPAKERSVTWIGTRTDGTARANVLRSALGMPPSAFEFTPEGALTSALMTMCELTVSHRKSNSNCR